MNEWTICLVVPGSAPWFDVWTGTRAEALAKARDNYAPDFHVTATVVCAGDIIATGVLTPF